MNTPSPASFNYWQEALDEFRGINMEQVLENCQNDEVERILVEAESIPSGFLVGDK